MASDLLLPGPLETAKLFDARRRVSASAHTLVKEPLVKEAELQSALDKVDEFYQIRPSGVPVYISKRGLRPWQGGVSWIIELREPPVSVVTIQLRNRVLGYDRTELLAHEYVHAARVAYDEPRYEEFFAYQLSESRFRRYWGPLFQSHYEPLIFIVSWLIGLLGTLFSLVFWLPAVWLAVYGIVRLVKRHRTLDRCVANIAKAYPEKNAWAMAYRLTDREIELFSRWDTKRLRAYAARCTHRMLRWSAIEATLGSVT